MRTADLRFQCLQFGQDSSPHLGIHLTAQGALDAEDTGFSYHIVKPDKRQGFAHRHDKAEEVYVVIGGTGRVNLDGEVVELQRLDAIRVAPAVARAFEAGPDGLELLAFGPHHEGDGELIHDDVWPS
jgi:mannose-6-phosphate isomerase-like protein (cupin superfamily)